MMDAWESETSRDLGKLEGKVDGLEKAFMDLRKEVRNGFEDMKQNVIQRLDGPNGITGNCSLHSIRIGKLENWRWWLVGIVVGGLGVFKIIDEIARK